MNSFKNYIENQIKTDDADNLTVNVAGSLLESMRRHNQDEVSDTSLRMWIVDMVIGKLKKSTRKKYFSRLHTLYREWKSVAGQDPFADLNTEINTDFDIDNEESVNNLALVPRLLKKASDSTDRETIDIILYLLYNVSASIGDVINLRLNDETIDCPQIDDIIEETRNASKRTKYVFGLSQGQKRELQIVRELLSGMHRVLKDVGMRFGGSFSRESITAMWITAALKVGIPTEDIRSVITTVPDCYSVFKLIPVMPMSQRQHRKVICRVADSINNKASQWFVMRIRQGNTPDEIKRRIQERLPQLYKGMLFYHPTHKVTKLNARNKRVTEDQPYLPGVMFFKTGSDKVTSLFSQIGDMAWCYKWANSPHSPYCTISRNEMAIFQRYIGEFTPDISVELVSRTKPIEHGSIVKISGGGVMEGHEGIVESVRNTNGTRTYTLRLTDYLEATWTVKDIAEVFIDPVKS